MCVCVCVLRVVWEGWVVLCDVVWCCARASIRVRSQLEGIMDLEKIVSYSRR